MGQNYPRTFFAPQRNRHKTALAALGALRFVKRYRALLFLLGTTALIEGCAAPVRTFEPLVDNDHAVCDPELEGKWVAPGSGQYFAMQVEHREKEKCAYTVMFSWLGGNSEYAVRVGRWQSEEFADVESASGRKALDQEANAFMVQAKSFCRIRHEGDFLWLAFMDSGWAKEHFPPAESREFENREFGDNATGIVFTGSTEELQRLVLKPVTDSQEWVEVRFAKDGTLAANTSLLSLGNAAAGELYAEKGRYEKAATAWQRFVELEPQYPYGHSELGLALVGANKPTNAREEFAEAIRRCSQAPALTPITNVDSSWFCVENGQEGGSFNLGVAYFIADQYKEASREFQKEIGVSGYSHWNLVWAILALRGAGKDADARKLLEEAAKQANDYFAKSAVADYFRGKIDEAGLTEAAKQEQTQCSAHFVIGSLALIANDKIKAREWFQKAVRENICPYDVKYAPAVTARLKQLGGSYSRNTSRWRSTLACDGPKSR